MNTKLYRICYKEDQFTSPSGARYTDWNNLENLEPDLCEYPIFRKAFDSTLTKNLDYWGLVSPKFDTKAGITGETFLSWIDQQNETHPPFDVYFINPVPIVEAIFPGTIQHGENCHNGLLGLLQRNLSWKTQIDLSQLYMDSNTFSMCNYFIGNRKFWTKYIYFVDTFLASVATNPRDNELMYAKSANYGPNKTLPFYTFVVERLFSIFLNLYRNEITFSHYSYSREALLTKTGLSPVIVDELRAISDIKQMALSAGYFSMMQHWVFLRNKLTEANQYLFLME